MPPLTFACGHKAECFPSSVRSRRFQTRRFAGVAPVRASLLLGCAIAALGLAPAVRAESASVRIPEPKPLLPWLGPLSPQSVHLPEVPSTVASPQRVWTIEQALARALEANPDVQVALATVQRQDGLRLQAAAAMLPRLGISASANQRDTDLIDRSENERANVPPSLQTAIADRGYDARIELRQTLFNGLANWHQVRRLAVLQKKASVDARELYLRVASHIRQAFDATLLRQTLVGTRQQAVDDLRQLARVAQRRFEAGDISDFEQLRAQTALRSAEAELAQAESDLARAQEQFCRILYIEKPPEGVQLAGSVAPLRHDEGFDAALGRAKANRLDVRSAELQLEAAQMAQQVARGGLLPRLEAYVDYGYRSSYYDVDHQLQGWSVGVVGRWDLFDGGQTYGAMRAQRAERRIGEIRLAEAQRLVGAQVRELYVALEQSRIVMAAHASARDLGERSVREARRLFEVGGVSLEQVLNAEVAYRQALAGWHNAVFTHNATIYQLDYATASEEFLDAAAPPP
jgi:outer membrane protein TolC